MNYWFYIFIPSVHKYNEKTRINQIYIKFFLRKITHRRMKKFNVKAKRFLL